MKIGIVFTGISHGYGRNYKLTVNNIKQILIDPYKKDNDVKTYLMTYWSDTPDIETLLKQSLSSTNTLYITSYKQQIANEIIKEYEPTLYSFLDIDGSHQISTFNKSLEQIRNQDLDLVICSRFDVLYNSFAIDYNIDYNRFNCLFREADNWWETFRFTCDNFFTFPYYMLEDFIETLDSLYRDPPRKGKTDMHQAFYRMQCKIGVDKTHVISVKNELSHDNGLYKLIREKPNSYPKSIL